MHQHLILFSNLSSRQEITNLVNIAICLHIDYFVILFMTGLVFDKDLVVTHFLQGSLPVY